MAEFPALPLWTDAYLGDTNHLSTIEHGAYLLLLVTAWRSKHCDLPDDDKMLARFTRLTQCQWRRIKPVIQPYWQVKNGRWMNGRLLDELEAVRRQRQQRSDAGKSSALKRLHRGSTVVSSPFNENPTPIPIKEVSKTFPNDFVVGKGNGKTKFNEADRLAIFQKKLAARFPVDGWLIVKAAADPSSQNHSKCLALCKAEAVAIGKGWPWGMPQ